MPSAASECPDCGHEFVVERRELQTVDGELQEVTSVDRKREQAQANTLDELIHRPPPQHEEPRRLGPACDGGRSLRSGKAGFGSLMA
jgi:hypothetical protein